MKKFRWLAVAIAIVMVMTCVLAACNKKNDAPAPAPETPEVWGEWTTVTPATCVSAGLEKRTSDQDNVETRAINPLGHDFKNHICSRCGLSDENPSTWEYGVDYISLYEQLGAKATIADVVEGTGAEQGRAYIYVKDGKISSAGTEGATRKELGMDFLSMAMVYNTAVPENQGDDPKWRSENDVYANWWKLYIERWNLLLPEIPLYSNEYYDMYNKKLGGVTENPTNPYWNPASALIDWTSSDNKIILGSSTDLSGKFRMASFGASSPGASDNDVAGLVNGLATVTTNKEGGYQWDETVVKSHKETLNADGTLTFEIEINEGLKFSDGSAIKAKNYLASTLAFSTPVANQAAGRDHKAGLSYVGYKAFAAYNGSNASEEGVSRSFSGLKLLGDYKFSVTVSADYATYFYKIAQASFAPTYLSLWLNDADIATETDGSVYLTDAFYAKTGDSYNNAAHIKASSSANDTTKYPFSGPYVVKSYDASKKEATLEKNANYAGNYQGHKPSITTVVYKKVISSTQLADFKAGDVDVLSAITGGDATDEAIAYAAGADKELGTADDQAIMTNYSRAGYGKLGFRGDFGPVQFTAVRQAIAYCLNRPSFASQFTGGYGGVVNGPYYTGAWMYKANEAELVLELDKYTTSVESAKAALIADGWIYNADGSAYDESATKPGVRYKKFEESQITEKDRNFAARDDSLKTGKITEGGKTYYLMPLVLNWFGTVDNEFSDILIKDMVLGENFKKAGFAVKYTLGDFAPMLDELYQAQVYGYYGGTPVYTCFNFATGFNSAAYDYAYNWSIDPQYYEDYSACYIKDTADFYRLEKAE